MYCKLDYAVSKSAYLLQAHYQSHDDDDADR